MGLGWLRVGLGAGSGSARGLPEEPASGRAPPRSGSAERHLPYPVVGKPRCFIRFLTSSDSSCRSERRYRLRRCWLIHSAVLLECLLPFLLSRRAHCMLLRRSSGCSDWSLEHELRWWLVLMPQCSLTSLVSSQSSTLIEICDWKPSRSRGMGGGQEGFGLCLAGWDLSHGMGSLL